MYLSLAHPDTSRIAGSGHLEQAVIYGPSGEGKTFVALDWALSVATGRSWQGKQTKQGPVVYIAGGRWSGSMPSS